MTTRTKMIAAGIAVGIALGLGLAIARPRPMVSSPAGVAAVSGLIGAVLAWALTTSRGRRLMSRRIAESIERIADGDLESRVPPLAGKDASRSARALRRVVRELRRSRLVRSDLDRLIGSMNCGLIALDQDLCVRSANAQIGRMLGCDPDELRRASIVEIVENANEVIEGAMDTEEPVEVSLRARDGSIVPALLSISRSSSATVKSDSICVVQETRGLREVEERLQRINVRLWLFNQITNIALRSRELDLALEVIAETVQSAAGFSATAFALYDPTERSLRMAATAGLDASAHKSRETRERMGSLLWHVVTQRESMILHLENTDLDLDDALMGKVQGAALGMFPMRVDDRVLGVLVLLLPRDPRSIEQFGHEGAELAQHAAALIDHRIASEALRRSNEEIEFARLAAEEANQAKSEFLANMSHEIRTPMTAILGYAELVRDDALANEETKEFVSTIRRNGEHLISIINDILDLSKIEAGRMTVERTPCTPHEIAKEVIEMFRRRADDRGIGIELALEWPLPRQISTDPTRLRQILANLVGNAVKFTEQGSISLTVRRATPVSRQVVFQVRDSGIGMNAIELAEIFKPFSQADSSHTRRFGGTGLGLAISQRLATLLGGAISVQSRKGSGSTFSIDVDGGELALGEQIHSSDELRRRTRVPAEEAEPGTSTCSARVLLAEDGADNQRLISHILGKSGAQVVVVGDGRAAVDAAFEAQEAGAAFDIVLMDMQMPVLDGYGATRELRERGYTRPIVALTAHAMTGDRERCLETGCDAFLSKPIDRKALIAKVRECARRHADVVES